MKSRFQVEQGLSWRRWEGISLADAPMCRILQREGDNVTEKAADLRNAGLKGSGNLIRVSRGRWEGSCVGG